MPGYAFHLEVLKQARLALSDDDRTYAALLESPFARLGAFGPDLLMYAPPIDTLASDLANQDLLEQLLSKTNPAGTDLDVLQDLYLKPVGSAYSALFSRLVLPLWPQLLTVMAFLQDAASIAASENTGGLSGLFADLQNVVAALGKIGTNTEPALKTLLSLTTLIEGGPWMEVAPPSVAALTLVPKADPKACRPYEFLRWHRSGQFASALWANATTDNQKAFALGWMSHVAASVTGEPFVNNIVGGPYRTHWWRNRLAANFIDAWTFGFHETASSAGGGPTPTMSGDTPTPAYQDWAPLYGANLQELFDVSHLSSQVTNGIPAAVTAMTEGISTGTASNLMTTLSAAFPSEITDQLNTALAATYPTTDLLLVPPGSLTGEAFSGAYVGAFAVFWFLTSGQGPLGNNIVGPPPSVSCGTNPPAWAGSGSTTPPPQSGSVVTTHGSAVCEAILAILAILSFLTGNIGAGVGFLVGALEEQPSVDINWPVARCDIFWIQTLVDKLLNALRDALWMLTLAYPPPIMLGGQDADGDWLPATDFTDVDTSEDPPASLPGNDPPTGGVWLTKTHSLGRRGGDVAREIGYPLGLDTGPGPDGKAIVPDLDFFRFPLQSVVETNASVGLNPTSYEADDLVPPDIYPNAILNSTGALNGGIMQPPAAFPSARAPLGDAVGNAIDVIRAKAAGLPDYNLDGDQGYGWLGWRPAPLSNPATLPVKVLPDSEA